MCIRDSYRTDTVKLDEFLLRDMPDYDEVKDSMDREDVSIMGAEDYNKMAEQQGKSRIELKQNEFAISYDIENLSTVYDYYEKNQTRPILVAGQKLSIVKNGIRVCSYQNDNGRVNEGTVIVPQSLAEKLIPEERILNIVLLDDSKETYNRYLNVAAELPRDIRIRNKQDVIVQMASDLSLIHI